MLKTRQPQKADKIHQLGTVHTNEYAHKNGFDSLDQWAEKMGNAERSINRIKPSKHVSRI